VAHAWLAAIGIALSAPAAADLAVVVGVNRYPKMPSGHQLRGAVNDADLVGAALEKRGFRVTKLLDEEATRPAVVAALRAASAASGASDRFVFYFAGFGTLGNPDAGLAPSLLLSGSGLDDTLGDLTASDLARAVRAIPAAAPTVILDCCFAGGMLPSSVKGLTSAKRKRDVLRGDATRVLAALQAGTKDIGSDQQGICWVAASRANQPAYEKDLDGVWHGLFTYHLVRRLDEGAAAWGDVLARVSQDVLADTNGLQQPLLSPAFASAPAPSAPAVNVAPASTGALAGPWALYSADRRDGAVRIGKQPPQNSLRVGADVSFTARVVRGGHLVILELAPEQELRVWWPRAGGADACKVAAGATVRIPETDALQVDRAGPERLKAVLFDRAEDAAALLALFAAPSRGAGPRLLTVGDARKATFGAPMDASRIHTDDLSFEVVAPGRR
jgi:hypothetical protein